MTLHQLVPPIALANLVLVAACGPGGRTDLDASAPDAADDAVLLDPMSCRPVGSATVLGPLEDTYQIADAFYYSAIAAIVLDTEAETCGSTFAVRIEIGVCRPAGVLPPVGSYAVSPDTCSDTLMTVYSQMGMATSGEVIITRSGPYCVSGTFDVVFGSTPANGSFDASLRCI